MPDALLIALAASLGIHVAALFLPDVEMAMEPETLPLMAELKPLPPAVPRPAPTVEPPKRVEKQEEPKAPKAVKKKIPRRKVESAPSASPVLSIPAESPEVVPEPEMHRESKTGGEPLSAPADGVVPNVTADASPTVVSRLPERGRISYRVDRGDSNFEVGMARQEWEIVDGHYHLRSVVETTGLVWLFKSLRIEMESRGLVTADGLRPDSFSIRRNGQEAREKASFDWENMAVSVADRAPQVLAHGAQDLLSFNYQLGFMALPDSGTTLLVATGKKYGVYPLEVIGDEEISVPAGTMHTLHLRAPGANTTELWLAYDYLLLPVKIRHVDNKGNSLVQVATEIQLSPE